MPLTIETVEMHTGGEPVRIVVAGYPPIPGATILAKRRHARERLDHYRRLLMFEPRGHFDMYGVIPVEPDPPKAGEPPADLAVLFMHNEGYSTMCGHGIIGLATVVLEAGMLPATGEETVIRMDTPAGLVTARARRQGSRVRSVAFENVPSFVYAIDQKVEVRGIGGVRYDVAFGGAYYAYCDAAPLGLKLRPEEFRRLIEAGMAIKRAVMAALPIRHPVEEDLGFLYGTIFCGPPETPGAASRNVCIFAEGEVDRSPTGTGVSGRVALEHARGRLTLNQPFVVESLIGTRFTGRAVRTTRFGGFEAVVPEIEGSATITGRHEFLIAPDDPLRDGFILR